jgi:hypothetical protein
MTAFHVTNHSKDCYPPPVHASASVATLMRESNCALDATLTVSVVWVLLTIIAQAV